MKNKTLVFTATYNEAGNIEKFLDATLKFKGIDILIIDDNSPDKTWEIIESFQKSSSNLHLIKRSGKKGLDTAHKNAFQFAKEHSYKNLITMDADLSHDPDLIPKFIYELENRAFVIGSRYMEGGKNDMKLGRYILSFIGNKVIKFVLNIDCEEFTTSYRGFNLSQFTRSLKTCGRWLNRLYSHLVVPGRALCEPHFAGAKAILRRLVGLVLAAVQVLQLVSEFI